MSSSRCNCIPALPALACVLYRILRSEFFCQSMMALLLLHLILAEECLLCKIVKFLMTPREDDYKLCPTCRGYNVIKRNSLLSSLAKPQRSPLAICFPELGQADSRVQAAWRKLAARQIRIKLTLTHWKTCFKGFILAHHHIHIHVHGRLLVSHVLLRV